jgi:hypothetical protein
MRLEAFVHSPYEVFAMAAERRLLEEARHKLVISYFEYVFQTQRTAAFVSRPSAEGRGTTSAVRLVVVEKEQGTSAADRLETLGSGGQRQSDAAAAEAAAVTGHAAPGIGGSFTHGSCRVSATDRQLKHAAFVADRENTNHTARRIEPRQLLLFACSRPLRTTPRSTFRQLGDANVYGRPAEPLRASLV